MNEITTKEVAMMRRSVDAARLDEAIARASESLVALQHPDGHWVFELEADVTIPSEFILLQHYFGRIEPELQARIAKYIRATQGMDGGWPLFHGGALDLSYLIGLSSTAIAILLEMFCERLGRDFVVGVPSGFHPPI